MDELQRILNQGNSHFIPELKNRWGTFCEKAQFYGVFKKVMRPPLSDKGNYRPDRESLIGGYVCVMFFFSNN